MQSVYNLPIESGCLGPYKQEAPEPQIVLFEAAHIVPCKDNIDQNPGPLSKSFCGLSKKVSGHFVIPTGFPIRHSTNVARELSKFLDGISDGLA